MIVESAYSSYIPLPIPETISMHNAEESRYIISEDQEIQVSPSRKVEREVEKKPLSFNLSAERKRAQEAAKSGDEIIYKLAQDGFINNFSYWSKEYLAKVHTAHYYWEIVTSENPHEVQLFHPQFGYSHEMADNAISENVPEYELARRKIERNVDTEFRKSMLPHAKSGDTFIWLSPPPDGIENDTYGGYSIAHLYEVKSANGKDVFVGRDVINRLSLEDQRKLLEHFAGDKIFEEQPNELDILSTVIKTQRGISSLNVEQLIKSYSQALGNKAETQEELKIQAIDAANLSYQDFMIQIFEELSKEKIDEAFVSGLFDTLARRVYAEFHTNLLKNKGSMSMEEMQEYIDDAEREYDLAVGGGSCGDGVGFEDDIVYSYQGAFGYTPQTVATGISSAAEGKKTLSCTCPFCNQRVEAMIEGGRITCPKPSCGKSAPYNC